MWNRGSEAFRVRNVVGSGMNYRTFKTMGDYFREKNIINKGYTDYSKCFCWRQIIYFRITEE